MHVTSSGRGSHRHHLSSRRAPTIPRQQKRRAQQPNIMSAPAAHTAKRIRTLSLSRRSGVHLQRHAEDTTLEPTKREAMVRKLVALRLVHGNVPPETAVASVFRESEQESELIMSTTCLSKPVITLLHDSSAPNHTLKRRQREWTKAAKRKSTTEEKEEPTKTEQESDKKCQSSTFLDTGETEKETDFTDGCFCEKVSDFPEAAPGEFI